MKQTLSILAIVFSSFIIYVSPLFIHELEAATNNFYPHDIPEFLTYTSIPDANFEQALIDLGVDSEGTLDGQILTSDALAQTTLDVSSKTISDLTGIEAFTNLTILRCYENQLTSLNISNLTALEDLDCLTNPLGTLDVSSNTALIRLNCDANQLSSLNVSNNTALKRLVCSGNAITSLDISNNTLLEELQCQSNQLSSLDISQNTALTELYCSSNQFTNLDFSNNLNLTTISCSNNPLGTVDVSNNTSLGFLYCTGNQLNNLDVSNNTALQFLHFDNNNITSIDISANTTISELVCSLNPITSLNLSNNTALSDFFCSATSLINLDLSANTSLTYFECNGNTELRSIDIRNGNNTNIPTSNFSALNNTLLTCINVDDAAWSTTNWTNISAGITFSENCPINGFVTTWKTDNPGTSNSTSITIPTFSGETYNYDVDWDNDGTFDQFGITGDVTHDFGTAGTKTIVIKGDFPRIYFNNGGDREKILSVDKWGDIIWTNMFSAFSGCTNLNSTASDNPVLTLVTELTDMFFGASSFNGDISNWNVSNVTNMSGMFYNASSFNQNIGNWNVSKVTNMRGMFRSANSFNQDISGWDVSKVTDMGTMFHVATSFNQNIGGWNVGEVLDMSGMFATASSFNQDISGWNVSKVTLMITMFDNNSAFNQNISSWNVGNVTSMWAMFSGASSFNQDISGWNVSKVQNMAYMFRNAGSFDQNLGGWNIGAVQDMQLMLNNSGLSVTNYDNTLIGWETKGVSNITLGATGLKYCNGETARNSLTGTYNWTITGDNLDCSSLPIELLYFQVHLKNNNAYLSWATSMEVNNHYFDIERSYDGVSFEIIGQVQGVGDSKKKTEYHFNDESPSNKEGLIYYRIKQVDYDETYTYSDIISALFDTNSIKIYPNPVSNILFFEKEDNHKVSVKIYDQIGEMVNSFELLNFNDSLDISELINGVYYMESYINGKIYRERFIKI